MCRTCKKTQKKLAKRAKRLYYKGVPRDKDSWGRVDRLVVDSEGAKPKNTPRTLFSCGQKIVGIIASATKNRAKNTKKNEV